MGREEGEEDWVKDEYRKGRREEGLGKRRKWEREKKKRIGQFGNTYMGKEEEEKDWIIDV